VTDEAVSGATEDRRKDRSRPAVLVALVLGAVAGFASDVPAATGLAVLSLAGLPVVFAVPPRGRPVVGGAIIAVAAAVLVLGRSDAESLDALAWAAALAVGAAGAVMAWRGRSWPALGRRFSSPADQTRGPADLWRELDRGNDPTLGRAGAGEPPEPPAARPRHEDGPFA
jgi:hypothetical protein